MDTILYFYQKRNNTDDNKNLHINTNIKQLICEEAGYEFADFEIIHLALSPTAAYMLGMTDDKEDPDNVYSDSRKHIFGRLLRHSRIKKKREEKLKNELKNELMRRIAAYWEKNHDTYWACNENILLPDRLRFDNYTDEIWMDRMLLPAKLPDYILIGDIYGIGSGMGKKLADFLLGRARRMRSLTIYVTHGDYDKAVCEIEELETILYEEYGLAVMITMIQNSRYRGINLEDMPAANILDMTQDNTLPCIKVPEGSRWFDLSCSSDKKRKVENCLKNVSYYSVNEMFANPWKWKTARFS